MNEAVSSKPSQWWQKPLYLGANAIITLLLVVVFITVTRSLIVSQPLVKLNQLDYLKPNPMDYFWRLNINNADIDRNQIRYYENYYEHLWDLFAVLKESRAVLAVCAFYLGDTNKAKQYWQELTQEAPQYFWAYYNLGILALKEHDAKKAKEYFSQLLTVDPQGCLQWMLKSNAVFLPLMEVGKDHLLEDLSGHMKQAFEAAGLMLNVLEQASLDEQETLIEGISHYHAFVF